MQDVGGLCDRKLTAEYSDTTGIKTDIFYAKCYYSNAGPVSTALITIFTQLLVPNIFLLRV